MSSGRYPAPAITVLVDASDRVLGSTARPAGSFRGLFDEERLDRSVADIAQHLRFGDVALVRDRVAMRVVALPGHPSVLRAITFEYIRLRRAADRHA
jgi:hypothetical protein